jgi:hypothetical protein
MERAGGELALLEPDPGFRRNTVLMKMNVVDACRAALSLADEQAVYLDLWYVIERWHRVVTPEDLELIFGEHSEILKQALTDALLAVRLLGPNYLSSEQIAQIETQFESISVDQDVPIAQRLVPADHAEFTSSVGQILGKPLNVLQYPLRAVNPGTGLSETAAAVALASDTVDDLRTEVQYLPGDVRHQVELLLIELEDSPTVIAALASMSEFSESSARLATVAEELPSSLRGELSQFVTEVEESQSELQVTLREVQGTLSGVDGTLERVSTTLASSETTANTIGTTANSLSETAVQWTGLVQEIDRFVGQFRSDEESPEQPTPEPEAPASPEDESGGFDIEDYGRTADSLTESARALSELVARVDAVLVPDRTEEVAEIARGAVRETLNSVLLRLGAFLVFVAALALGYRYLVRRAGTG